MKVRKRPTLINAAAPVQGQYHQGPVLTNGALEFVYDRAYDDPVFTLVGAGVPILSQVGVLSHQIFATPVLTTAPVYGAGVPSGGVDAQHLIEQDDH